MFEKGQIGTVKVDFESRSKHFEAFSKGMSVTHLWADCFYRLRFLSVV